MNGLHPGRSLGIKARIASAENQRLAKWHWFKNSGHFHTSQVHADIRITNGKIRL